MCGFTAILARNEITSAEVAKLKSAALGMSYRGPDESGLWNDSKVALSHVRLSIIGLKNGRQPIVSADGKLVVICNGEIYNHRSLRNDLVGKGYIFSTLSDSEVIIHSYIEYGLDFLKMIKGMFAFVLYDIKQGQVIAVRDVAGKKPLYYAETKEGWIFSSELKAIAENFIAQPEINFESIRQVQLQRYSLSERSTFIKTVEKVLPGTAMIFSNRGLERILKYKKRIVSPSFSGSYDNAVKSVRDALFSAVERRLDAEVPVGLLLSAGIDSSAIACIAKKLGHQPVAFSAGYEKLSATDESFEAKNLAELIDLPFQRVILDEAKFINDFKEIINILDEPNADPAMFPQWSIFRLARSLGYKVLLSGVGGDEVFYGYAPKNTIKPKAALSRPSRLRKLIFILERLLDLNEKKSQETLIHLINRTLSNKRLFAKPVLNEVLLKCSNSGLPKEEFLHSVDFEQSEVIDQTYSALHKIYLPNNGFFLADKLGMAHSIEVRCPFADKDLADFIDTLPLDYKYPKGRAKGLLKDALKDIVPDFILDRPKTGFTSPPSYLQKLVEIYHNKFYSERAQTFAHVVTDAMCAKFMKKII